MEIKGIFVTSLDKANAKLCFDEIVEKYGDRTGRISGNSMQKSAIMTSYCHDLNDMIGRVFISEIRTLDRCVGVDGLITFGL